MSSPHLISETGQKWAATTEERGSQDTDSSVESISSADTPPGEYDDVLRRTVTATSDHMSLSQRVTTIATNATSDPNYEVDWDGPDDDENPRNWTLGYKAMTITFLSWNTLIV